jgi:hypothetical protein
MPLVIEVAGMDRDDLSRHLAGFGIPADMITDFECLRHCASPERIT